jgi:hypothetical protein
LSSVRCPPGIAFGGNRLLVGEQGLQENFARLEVRRLEQRHVRPGEFRLDEAARVGRRAHDVAGIHAAGAEPEPIEGDESVVWI